MSRATRPETADAETAVAVATAQDAAGSTPSETPAEAAVLAAALGASDQDRSDEHWAQVGGRPKIAHLFSPFAAAPDAENGIAQAVTFASMRRAAAFGAEACAVEHLAYMAEEADLSAPPDFATALPLAERTAADVVRSRVKRPFPLIGEMVRAALARSDADILIYSNVDIAVQPYFYEHVANRLKSLDALVINRRTVRRDLENIEDITQFYMQTGKRHPGYDCFAARREIWEQAEFDDAFVGGNWIGRVLLLNMIAHSDRFWIEAERQLTFHLGDDRTWKHPRLAAHHSFNQRALIRVAERLLAREKAPATVLQEVVDGHTRGAPPGLKPGYLNDFSALSRRHLGQKGVFVVGFPRSGTTLAQSVLARGDARVRTAPETHFFNIARRRNIGASDIFDQTRLEGFRRALEEKIALGPYARARLDRPQHEPTVKEVFEIVLRDQLEQVYGADLDPSRDVWVEKTPSHALSLPQLHALYPSAKFLYCLRHPVFAFTSWRRHAKNWGAVSTEIKVLAGLYQEHLQAALAFQDAHPDAILFVKLEELAVDPTPIFQRMAAFTGLSVPETAGHADGAALGHLVKEFEPHKREAVEADLSPSVAFPQKILLRAEEIEEVWDRIGSLMARVGYDRTYPIPRVRPPLRELRAAVRAPVATPLAELPGGEFEEPAPESGPYILQPRLGALARRPAPLGV